MVQLAFNAQEFDPAQGIEVWSDGWKKVIINASETRENNGGKSGRLSFTLLGVGDDDAKGKTQFIGLNKWHENAQTVEIANRTLSAIVWVTLGANAGRLTFNDTSEMHNIPFFVLASSKKGDDQVNRNEFRSFKDQFGVDAGKQTGGPAQAAAPAFGQQPVAPPAAPAPAFAPPPAAPAPAFAPAPMAQQPAPAFATAPQAAPAFAPAPQAAPAFAPAPAAAPPAAQPAWNPQAAAQAPGGAPGATPPWKAGA